MEIVHVEQGTPEWHAHRRNHLNASDAPAMMGLSPYTTRSEFIAQWATGIYPEVTPEQQRIFDKGHRFERLARPVAETIIGDELAPLVGKEGKYSASFDGLTLMGDTAFEHKMLNATLRQAMVDGCTGSDLPLLYQVQMEHQCMVGQCQRVLFVASDWNDDDTLKEERHCWYTPNPALRARIVGEWAQAEADKAAYVAPAVLPAAPVGRAPDALPALLIKVTGAVTDSNLEAYREHAMAVFAGINRELTTDAHFADAERTVTWCGEVESRLAAAKEHALSQTASIEVLFRTIDDISAEARRVRLGLEKLVEARKKQIRAEIVQEGIDGMRAHIDGLNKRLGAVFLSGSAVDFAAVIKGKKSLDSMRNAVQTLLAQAKVASSAQADHIDANLKSIRARPDMEFLFPDLAVLVLKAPDDLAAVIENRITNHEAAIKAREDEKLRASQEVHTQPIAAAAPAPAPAVLQMPVRAAAPVPRPMTQATLKLGDIAERLGFALSAAFLKTLGFEPSGRNGAHGLYQESEFPQICAALVAHVEAIQARAAA